MFPIDFPYAALRDAEEGQWVLDPFCGHETTLYAARLRGIGAVGIDANPVAASLTKVKLISPRATTVIERCEELLSGGGYTPTNVPTGSYWQWAFKSKTLKQICSLRAQMLIADEEFAHNCS